MAVIESVAEPEPASGPGSLEELSSERLEAQICALAGRLAAQECVWLDLIGEFDRREGYAAWGCQSTAYWLNWHCGLSKGAARERVRVARALQRLDVVRAEFAAGRLSYSKVRAITRVATPATETMLVELGLAGTAVQLERICAGYRQVKARSDGRDPAAGEEADAAARKLLEQVSVFHDDDGMTQLRAAIVPEDGALVEAALATALEDLAAAEADGVPAGAPGDRAGTDHDAGAATSSVPAGTPEGPPRPSRVDALVELARHYLSHRAPTPTIERRHLVLQIDVGALTESGELGIDGDGRCTLNGQRITPATAQQLGLDPGAPITTVLIDHRGLPLSVGRTSRYPTPTQRLALHIRDGGRCRYPGCPNQRADAHHIIDWDHFGPTDYWNLLLLCGFHHHLVHRSGSTITLDPTTNLATFRRPDGTEIAARTSDLDDAPPPPTDIDAPPPGEAGTRLELHDIVENLAWHDDHHQPPTDQEDRAA